VVLTCSRPLKFSISAVTGYATGILTAATGVFILPMVVFLQSLELDKEEMIQALGASFLICTVALCLSVGWQASLTASFSRAGLLSLTFALTGLGAGAVIRRFLNVDQFRRVLFSLFILLGLGMLARSLKLI
jgi:uncharacterized membrane protein YfcA